MEIKNAFTIEAPYREVWDALLDVERVAPCMPGAQIEERLDDAAYNGRFRIKVGPVTAAYRGRIEIAERDDDRGVVVMRGSGNDASGAGTANAVITSTVTDRGDHTEVEMVTELDVTGRVAQFGGRGSMMQSIADRMVNQFADRLRKDLLSPPEPEVAATNGSATNGHGAGHGAPAASAGSAAAEPEAFDAGGLMKELVAERAPAAIALAAVVAFVLGLLIGRSRNNGA
jgi:carbon monoxide dehydrogenase subunit G